MLLLGSKPTEKSTGSPVVTDIKVILVLNYLFHVIARFETDREVHWVTCCHGLGEDEQVKTQWS